MAMSLLLGGCFTGQRPHFSSEPFPSGSLTGDEAIDAVLTKLDGVSSQPTTALYAVLTKFGNTTTSAQVAIDGAKRAIEIRNVQYVDTGEQQLTCSTDGSQSCTNGFDLARISDVGITVDFYAADTATRLRRDSVAKIGPAVAHEETIANQPAHCVALPLSGGTAEYCVLDNGLLARLDDGDVLITLGLYSPTVDPAKLRPAS